MSEKMVSEEMVAEKQQGRECGKVKQAPEGKDGKGARGNDKNNERERRHMCV